MGSSPLIWLLLEMGPPLHTQAPGCPRLALVPTLPSPWGASGGRGLSEWFPPIESLQWLIT